MWFYFSHTYILYHTVSTANPSDVTYISTCGTISEHDYLNFTFIIMILWLWIWNIIDGNNFDSIIIKIFWSNVMSYEVLRKFYWQIDPIWHEYLNVHHILSIFDLPSSKQSQDRVYWYHLFTETGWKLE